MAKYVKEYQALDDDGSPLGPPQRFEADTLEELADRLAKSNENATASLYKTRRQVKLGETMEVDPEEPLPTYEERPLTADERVKINTLMQDPATAPDAYKILLEAQFGAPLSLVRQALQKVEVDRRKEMVEWSIVQFRNNHPEYIGTETNRMSLRHWLQKRSLPMTQNNLEVAFENLVATGKMVVQAPEPTTREQAPLPATPPAAIPPAETPAETASSVPAIPDSATPAAPISAAPQASAAPKPAPSGSSGLSGRSSAAAPAAPAPPKAQGLTWAEINKMDASEIQRRMVDPVNGKEFIRQMDELTSNK